MSVCFSREYLSCAVQFGFRELEDQVVLLDDPSTLYLKLTDIKLAGLRADLEDRLESLVGVLEAA